MDFTNLMDIGSGLPAFGQPQQKKHRTKREHFVPEVTSTQQPEVLQSPASNNRLDPATTAGPLFSIPGTTASADELAQAFTLEGNGFPATSHRYIDGQSTLWRQVPVSPSQNVQNVPPSIPTLAEEQAAGSNIDIYRRLDQITKQLEELQKPSQMQNSAELFLFVAIGLLLLLCIDTLLRFASSSANKNLNLVGGFSRGVFGNKRAAASRRNFTGGRRTRFLRRR